MAVKVTGEPLSVPLLAVRVLAPAPAPSVQLPTVAMPAALVVAVRPVAEPPPEATAKVTLTPGTGSLWTSSTMTLGLMLTAVPAEADWPSPALTAIWVAAAGSSTLSVSTLETLKLPVITVSDTLSATKKRSGPLAAGMTIPAGSL